MLKLNRFKKIMIIAVFVLAAFILLLYFYMKAEIPDSFALSGPIKVHFRGVEAEIAPGDDAYNSFAKWINDNRKGWYKHPSSYYITYAYDGFFEGNNFSMEYGYGRGVILWINNNPVFKYIDKKDFLFLYELNKYSNKKK